MSLFIRKEDARHYVEAEELVLYVIYFDGAFWVVETLGD